MTSYRQPTPPIAKAEAAFAELVMVAGSCRCCPRMEGRTRVLSQANGLLSARILFIAEAPGRLGADVYGVPLSGDRTGRTFEELLSAAELRRDQVFITNAVLCNPRDQAGRNDRPTPVEISNCSQHLSRLIQILNPEWVVTLGGVALSAVARLEQHHLVLNRDVASPVRWLERWLVPLYHPGPRALIHRSLSLQRADYIRLARLVAADAHTNASPTSASTSGSSKASEI